uniref:Uncharacterized protein n=1 Tax=Melopsittacus undulatus TaxID=13146 RepID=A0A8V5GV41_MELUD
MCLYGSLWVSMGLYGSLWVSMCLYGSLWVSMCLYVSLCVSMGLYGSLCVSMGQGLTHTPPIPIPELLPKGTREEQRDYIFYMALGNYRLKEYERALEHVERLLGAEPQNTQGLRLRQRIQESMRRGETHRDT